MSGLAALLARLDRTLADQERRNRTGLITDGVDPEVQDAAARQAAIRHARVRAELVQHLTTTLDLTRLSPRDAHALLGYLLRLEDDVAALEREPAPQ